MPSAILVTLIVREVLAEYWGESSETGGWNGKISKLLCYSK